MKKLAVMIIALTLLVCGGVLADPCSDTGISNPAFCNRVEAGSYIDLSVANVQTSIDTRFIMNDSDDEVGLNYEITVGDLGGIPSRGEVQAYIEIMVREGRGDAGIPTGMFEELKYSDTTGIQGAILYFTKDMAYWSSPI